MSESAFGSIVDVEGQERTTTSAPRRSMYLDLFEEMLDAVLTYEQFLFSPAEIQFFHKYRELSAHAQYLLIRLTLRKTGAWFRHCKLETQYSIDLGPNTLKAMRELSECEFVSHETGAGGKAGGIIRFAFGDEGATTEDLLNCLQRDELKELAKKNNAGHRTMNMKALRDSLLSHTGTQTILPFRPTNASRTKQMKLESAFRASSTSLSAVTKTVKSNNLRSQILRVTTPSIRIGEFSRNIFNRLNLIYLRSTSIVEAEALLLPCILNRARKRSYPAYSYDRTATIFRTRDELLSYEEALRTEAAVDAAITAKENSKDPSKPQIMEAPRRTRARVVRSIWEKTWDKWAALVAKSGQSEKTTGFERFECGYVLTRVIYKGAEALATLNEHDLEIEVLKALLAQTRWRRTKRGAWWERLALVYMSYGDGDEEENRKQALETVIQGLDDPYTHTKYRPTLERRMKRLESLLKLDKSERRRCQYKQKRHQTRQIEGERIWEEPEDLQTRKPVRPVLQDAINLTDTVVSEGELKSSESCLQLQTRPPEVTLAWKKGKSVWKGRDGEEVTVEGLSLQHYEKMGFKGVHSEGSIVGTLFSLLFWDVLFAAIPGAFETPYQTAPLDLWEDSFYWLREDLIKARIQELESGRAAEILKAVDERERGKNTWCVGVKWASFSQEDLLEVIECMGNAPLARLCTVLAEDYSLGTAGMPDLFVWDMAGKRSMFVEVKGPGDTLQENQKVWLDVLIKAGFVVEVCKVVEEGDIVAMEGEKEESGDGEEETERRRKRRKGAEPSEKEIISLLSEDEGDGEPIRSTGVQRPKSTEPVAAVRDEEGYVYQLSPPRKRKRKSI